MLLKNKTILVIDDTPSIHAFLRISLASEQAVLHESATGHDGLDKARIIQPDIIILDLGLPDIDGLDLLPMLKEACPPQTIIFILSVRRDYPMMEKAHALGANGYMAKPFVPFDLIEKLGSFYAAPAA